MIVLACHWAYNTSDLIGPGSILDPKLSASRSDATLLSLYKYISPTSSQLELAQILQLYAMALFALLTLIFPTSPLWTWALYCVFTSFKDTHGVLLYGVYDFLQIGLFYVALASVARVLDRSEYLSNHSLLRLVGRFGSAHIAMAYSFAGACKAVGPHWWSGESVWRALGRSDSTGQRWFDLYWAGHYPLLLQAAGIVVVILELGYPLAYYRKVRYFVVPGMIGMHLGTIALQGLTMFGITMICLNVFFWFERLSAECEQGEILDA